MDKPHYFGHRERLRERFEKAGLEASAPHEILELLLPLAIRRKDVKQLAKALLARFANVHGVLDAKLGELREVPGLGQGSPVALKIISKAANHFAHNHPNGIVKPSDQDRTLTCALVLAAETLQIKVLDHVIVSSEEVFSFARRAPLMAIADAVLREFPELNDSQREAVSHTDGPLLVIAGPGSGKTLVLVVRALNILLQGLAQPSELLLCTFTEKAAFEMRDRLSLAGKKLGYKGDLSELLIGTIHGVCNDFLMRYRHKTQLGNSYDIVGGAFCT